MATHGVLASRQMGNLAADPTFYKNGDQQVANFRVITNISWKDKGSGEERERVEAFNWELWGPSAENFVLRMKKGRRVYVEGEQRNDVYEKDGVKHYGVRFVCDLWQDCGGPLNGAAASSAGAQGGHGPDGGTDDGAAF